MTTMMQAFDLAKRNSVTRARDFSDKKVYLHRRNSAARYRRMAYVMVSAIAVGDLCDDGPSASVKAWMRLADCPFPYTGEGQEPWRLLAKQLGSYLRSLRIKEDNYRRTAR